MYKALNKLLHNSHVHLTYLTMSSVPPRPQAQTFVPQAHYTYDAGLPADYANLTYSDHAFEPIYGSYIAPAPTMIPPQPAQLSASHMLATRELTSTPDTMVSVSSKRRNTLQPAGASKPPTEPSTPPTPPALRDAQGLRCPSPSHYEIRGDLEAVIDRVARLGGRLDRLEQ